MTRPSVMKFQRTLVIDPNSANAKMLASLLRSIGPSCQVYGAQTAAQGLELAKDLNPDLVFVEMKGPSLDGIDFTRRLRRSEFTCREAPVVIITAEATAAAIVGARDAGVHEFLRRPYAMGDLQKRIDAVSGKPRDWIEAMQYVGPDRRRFNSADYKGPRKRRTDGSAVSQKINQALKIIQAAAMSMDSDPIQAARALTTQARILVEVSGGNDGLKRLGAAAASLQGYLAGAVQTGLSKEQIETFSANLIAVAPKDIRPKTAA
jgi:CheY-like chemotaxis protein